VRRLFRRRRRTVRGGGSRRVRCIGLLGFRRLLCSRRIRRRVVRGRGLLLFLRLGRAVTALVRRLSVLSLGRTYSNATSDKHQGRNQSKQPWLTGAIHNREFPFARRGRPPGWHTYSNVLSGGEQEARASLAGLPQKIGGMMKEKVGEVKNERKERKGVNGRLPCRKTPGN
jgi:hypothetical protein